MKIKSFVALTTLTTLLGAAAVYAADVKSEKSSSEKMDRECAEKMHGAGPEMHHGNRDMNGADREGGREGGRWNRDMDEDRGREFHEHMVSKLALSDAQKKTLDEQKEKQKATMDSLVEKQKAAKEALRKAAESNADDATITKLATDVGASISQTEIARIKARRQFMAILTPEQKQKLSGMEEMRRPDSRP